MLALPVYLLLLLLIRVDHNPYIVAVEEQITQSKERNQIYTFRDINNDGISEQIQIYNLPSNGAIIGYKSNGTIFESWNLYGRYYFLNPAFDFCDIDKDGFHEIYSITITPSDSVFVSQTILKARSDQSRKTFVTKLERHQEILDTKIEGLGISDITGDSVPEYLFAISAGYTLQPRAVYAWDITHDHILKSPFSGIAIKYNDEPVTSDLNNDGIPEIFLSNTATDNYKTKVPFSDTASYSLVLTKNLEFLYTPVLIAGPSSAAQSFPVWRNDSAFILTIARMIRSQGNEGKAILFDLHGNKKDSAMLANMNIGTRYHFMNDQVIFASQKGEKTVIGAIKNDLSLEEHLVIDGNPVVVKQADLDHDPEMEMVLLDTRKGILYILQDNLKTLTSSIIPTKLSSLLHISIESKRENETRFLVQMNDYRMLLSYHDNPFYRWRFAYYLLLYGMIYLVLLLLQKVFLFRSNRRKANENRIIKLQLQSVMNQLNPHFTFNAINTVGDSILNGRKNEAYENLTKLSELIRSSMDNAFQADKTLGDEIEFTRRYLELESVRFESKLTYTINIESNVDLGIKVPKMLLHIFVENAIKHGIFHKPNPGHISVKATRKNHETVITISDDGIGRKNARTITGDTGKGLKILDDYLVLFSNNYQREISYITEDLTNDIEVPGTLVTIRIKY